ncbi:uncharacterized protein DSM5745_03934 [Aspergillus mulundensis]|uniref:Uncharacterized protein n=1 Tax=Aspergillus mulundensis TaxID=1810919 RepID=A0A3D8SCW0_9EURO|nr:hypothetical protein DSM5745_03934 [Aspergillus mulundensis]RDW83608.1 hypothetical protein DSM5745_03934 [Aspergillus mulundensis]
MDEVGEMSLPEPPIWLRTSCGFTGKKTTNGVSSRYILWNLIRATEPVAIFVFGLCSITKTEEGAVFLHSPPSAGDWFTLWHCVVVAFVSLVLFMQVVIYSKTWWTRIKLVLSYIAFLLVSIVPVVVDAIWPLAIDSDNHLDREVVLSVFYAVHSMLIYQIIAALCIFGISLQARRVLAAPVPNALSLPGLAAQAVVYALLTVAWVFSLSLSIPSTFYFWFMVNGWIILDALVFSLGQALILGLALRRRSRGKGSGHVSPELGSEREREPLLGHRVDDEE